MGGQNYKGIFLLILLLFSQVALSQNKGSSKPNIIFIMADDLGYETLECYGNNHNQTPHLNKLAAQ
ncbi:MAG: hypothetical protein WD555_00990, partial [Fulvivirga sp.]